MLDPPRNAILKRLVREIIWCKNEGHDWQNKPHYDLLTDGEHNCYYNRCRRCGATSGWLYAGK